MGRSTGGVIGRFGRRGIVAGAAALLAGLLSRSSAKPAAAGHDATGFGDDALHLGQINTLHTENSTVLTRAGRPTTVDALRVTNDNGAAIHGRGPAGAPAILGDTPAGNAVIGRSGAGPFTMLPGGAGVEGASTSGAGVGVLGTGSRIGTFGFSEQHGVGGIGGPAGVAGESSSDTGAGVYGFSRALGVFGHGDKAGVRGESEEGVGVVGQSPTIGVLGVSRGGLAGFFDGHLAVRGSLTVLGAKSAAVPFPDGSLRRMHCLEAPVSWFEDAGEATVVRGKAEVLIGADFAQAADLSKPYHVFVTPHDPRLKGLAVVARLPDRFRVEDQSAGSEGTFSFRIMARRRSVGGERLEKVTLPVIPKLDPPPAPPNLPKPGQ